MLKIEVHREGDDLWFAEIAEMPCAMAYGATRQEAVERARALSLRVLADRLEHGESVSQMGGGFTEEP